MTDFINQMKAYLAIEKDILDNLPLEDINCVLNILERARLNGNKIFIFGNGGSASTASHFVCDFNKGVSGKQEEKYDFECLNDNVPMMMAVANDIGYEAVFVEPLKNKLKKNDIVIGISGSGNSENVVRAIEFANQVGAETIALCGYDGGKLKKEAKYHIHIKVDNMQIVEDVHLILDHMMMMVLSKTSALE